MKRLETIDELIDALLLLSEAGKGDCLIRMFNYDQNWYGDGLPVDSIRWDTEAEIYLMESE